MRALLGVTWFSSYVVAGLMVLFNRVCWITYSLPGSSGRGCSLELSPGEIRVLGGLLFGATAIAISLWVTRDEFAPWDQPRSRMGRLDRSR